MEFAVRQSPGRADIDDWDEKGSLFLARVGLSSYLCRLYAICIDLSMLEVDSHCHST